MVVFLALSPQVDKIGSPESQVETNSGARFLIRHRSQDPGHAHLSKNKGSAFAGIQLAQTVGISFASAFM